MSTKSAKVSQFLCISNPYSVPRSVGVFLPRTIEDIRLPIASYTTPGGVEFVFSTPFWVITPVTSTFFVVMAWVVTGVRCWTTTKWVGQRNDGGCYHALGGVCLFYHRDLFCNLLFNFILCGNALCYLSGFGREGCRRHGARDHRRFTDVGDNRVGDIYGRQCFCGRHDYCRKGCN